MNTTRKWKRRRLLVTPSFQWPVVVKVLILSVLVTGLSTWFIFYFLWRSLISTGNSEMIPYLHQPALWIGWGLCLLIGLTLAGWLMLKLTQRVAGQVFRFQQVLDQALAGETAGPITTRKDDYFRTLQTDLNNLLSKGTSDE